MHPPCRLPSRGFARSLRQSRASTRQNRITRQPLNGRAIVTDRLFLVRRCPGDVTDLDRSQLMFFYVSARTTAIRGFTCAIEKNDIRSSHFNKPSLRVHLITLQAMYLPPSVRTKGEGDNCRSTLEVVIQVGSWLCLLCAIPGLLAQAAGVLVGNLCLEAACVL